jgi:glycosyltransferase involved in cell wall biosynthesis
MSQNLFPFEWSMISQSGLSLRSLKLILLRWAQSWSFQRAAGVIFLTKYAQNAVLKVTGHIKAKQAVIAHGLNPRFKYRPKAQLPIDQYSEDKPYRLIYISTLDVYKNQAQVVLAVDLLRRKGYPVTLTLIGPAVPGALELLEQLQRKIDPKGEWLQYLGQLPYASLHLEYQKADLSIYASSCETFGMTVLENMSVGLPIACSSESSMHEVLETAGLYFDPHKPSDIAAVVEQYLLSSSLREEKQKMAYALSVQYSWKRCAQETVDFLRSVIRP